MTISKYNANGNDFIIFHTFRKIDRSNLAKKLCNRMKGIGADGLIVLIPHKKYDFEWQFYNSDGSEAKMCGNGSRAVAHYAYYNDLADKNIKFLTGAGIINASVNNNIVETELTKPIIIKELFKENNFDWWLIDTGVPHLVTFIKDLKEFNDIFKIELAKKMRVKYNANVNFAFIEKNDKIRVRTYERGVENETLACGTGMNSCFLRAYKEGLVNNSVKVYPTSGEELYIRIENDETLFFKGEVEKIFTTEI